MHGAAESAPTGRPRLVTPHATVRAALEQAQLRLRYLPVVDLESGRPRGVEALLRWQHPSGTLLGPDDFLFGVAHTPLMHDITGWVLRTAVAALAAWPGWTVSVNVTAQDVIRNELVQQVDDALEASGVAPERLILELTEQAMVESFATARTVLGKVRDRGVGLSLDDFGTGYSSLLYLRGLPITELKIDRTFVSGTPAHDEDAAIMRSVAALGEAIGVAVVAEGVETREQLNLVRDLGCTAAQGFLWGEPTTPEDVNPAMVELAAALALGPGQRPRTPAPLALSRSPEGIRIQQLLKAGASLNTIAAALNREGHRTLHKKRWTATTVADVIAGRAQGRAPRSR